jgi:hypothetical protein
VTDVLRDVVVRMDGTSNAVDVGAAGGGEDGKWGPTSGGPDSIGGGVADIRRRGVDKLDGGVYSERGGKFIGAHGTDKLVGLCGRLG